MAKFGLQDLADILVSKGGISYEEANDFVTSFFGLIQEGIELDEIVKIKGLGTFKLVTVEARESVNVNTGERVLIDSHGKVTFSPDATMKDIVNKPFSGFETVILNEGVTFDDMEPVIATEAEIESEESDESDVNNDTESDVVDKEKNELIATQDEAQDFMIEIAEEDNIETSDVVEQESVLTDAADDITREETPLDDKDEIISTGDTNTNQDVCVNNEEAVSEEAVSEEVVSEEAVSNETVSEDVVSEKNVSEEIASEEIASDDVVSEDLDVTDDVSENEVQSTQRGITWLGMTIVAFISLVVGFIAGVCLSDSLKDLLFDDNVKNETPILKDEPLQKDTAQIVVDKKVVSDSIKDSTIVKPEVSKPIEVQSSEPSEPEYKKYEKMDSRVLHGAYYIMGTASVVKTKKDDTSDRLSRRYLGNGMACYIEVYNGINASTVLPEGQDIKIPKLEWKKNVNKKSIKQ